MDAGLLAEEKEGLKRTTEKNDANIEIARRIMEKADANTRLAVENEDRLKGAETRADACRRQLIGSGT